MFGPTGWTASKISGAPHPATISVSAIVAHLNFKIPYFICNLMISDILCVLTCGLSRSGPPAISIIFLILASIRLG